MTEEHWHPSWCDVAACSDHDHASPIAATPASGASTLQCIVDEHWTTGHVPLVSVRTVYSTDLDDAPSVSLFVADQRTESEVNLRAHELSRLIELLQQAEQHITATFNRREAIATD